MARKKTIKKKDTGLVMDCDCGEKARIFELERGFMGHCATCGSLWFFDNPQLLERLRYSGRLCHHQVTIKRCKTGYTFWCPQCRLRHFKYSSGERQ